MPRAARKVFVNDAALHHKHNAPDGCDVFQQIAIKGDYRARPLAFRYYGLTTRVSISNGNAARHLNSVGFTIISAWKPGASLGQHSKSKN